MCMYVYGCVCLFTHGSYVYLYVCLYVYVYVYVYVYLYAESMTTKVKHEHSVYIAFPMHILFKHSLLQCILYIIYICFPSI